MRVLLFPSAYAPAVGGVEELTRRLADELAAAGDEVEVWTNRHPASLPAAETILGTAVRRFDLPLPRSHPSDLVRAPVRVGRALVLLRRAAATFRPDVVHVQCFSNNGVYAAALAASLRVPLVVTLQGETVMDDHDIYEYSQALRAGLRWGLRRASVVTACSRFTLDDAERRFGLPVGQGLVIPNGVDFSAREVEVPLDLPFDRFVLGLGRAVHKKGFDLLLDAFAYVAADDREIGLVIGGDGPVRAALIDQARDLGLGDRAFFPGSLGRGQVNWAMVKAAAFVLPSRVEPFGIVVLEALRAGTPVVVSSRGGAREIVRDGRDGTVVDPFDARALAEAISATVAGPARPREDEARQRLNAETFSWPSVSRRYRAEYARAVGPPTAS